MNGETPVPGCQATYVDSWGHLWTCESPWGHIEPDGQIVHAARIPVSWRHAAPPWVTMGQYCRWKQQRETY